MSKLEVDKIDPQSGTDLELGTSGDTITIPAGVTFDSSAATNTLPSTVVTTTGTQTLTNKNIVASQLTGTVAASNLGTGTADATTFLRGDQTYASATPADNSITTSQLAYNPNPFRNIIINGDMSINQRGTVTGISTNTYTLDRWITEGDDATLTISQDTSVPSAQGFATSLKIAVTTANASVAASDAQMIGQRIEGQLLQQLLYGTSSAKSFTLSFWVKSNITGTYAMQFQNDDNNKVQTTTYSISSADTWEKKTITISGDTASGFDNDANRSFRVLWWLAAGSDYTSNSASSGAWIARSSNINSIAYGHAVNVTSSTSNTFYLTGCQLEVGTTASEFEFLPHDVNENRCMRYFEDYKGANTHGGLYTGSSYIGHVFYKVRKRTRPSLSATGSFNNLYNSSGGDKGGTDSMHFGDGAGQYLTTLTIDAEL